MLRIAKIMPTFATESSRPTAGAKWTNSRFPDGLAAVAAPEADSPLHGAVQADRAVATTASDRVSRQDGGNGRRRLRPSASTVARQSFRDLPLRFLREAKRAADAVNMSIGGSPHARRASPEDTDLGPRFSRPLPVVVPRSGSTPYLSVVVVRGEVEGGGVWRDRRRIGAAGLWPGRPPAVSLGWISTSRRRDRRTPPPDPRSGSNSPSAARRAPPASEPNPLPLPSRPRSRPLAECGRDMCVRLTRTSAKWLITRRSARERASTSLIGTKRGSGLSTNVSMFVSENRSMFRSAYGRR